MHDSIPTRSDDVGPSLADDSTLLVLPPRKPQRSHSPVAHHLYRNATHYRRVTFVLALLLSINSSTSIRPASFTVRETCRPD